MYTRIMNACTQNILSVVSVLLCVIYGVQADYEPAPEYRLLKHGMFQATGDGFHLQMKYDDKWHYVAFEQSWAITDHHANVICKAQTYRQGAIYTITEKPGTLEVHVDCTGTEKDLNECEASKIKLRGLDHHVGVQCMGGIKHDGTKVFDENGKLLVRSSQKGKAKSKGKRVEL